MCVIAIVEDDDKRPALSHIRAMWNRNDHGGGVAWREDGKVKWHKGLTLREMEKYISELPVPYIAHFRVASCGGINPLLTHPFLVDEKATLSLQGETSGQVLFHNGHWSEWERQSKLWIAQAGGKIKVPHGQPWTDTRSMAFWAHHFGLGIFDGDPWGINEKVVVMSPEGDLDIFGRGWETFHGYIVSNDYWQRGIEAEVRKLQGNATREVTSYHTSAPQSILGLAEKRAEQRASSTGATGGSQGTAKHPFHIAREEFETALTAFNTKIGGVRQGSRNQVKKKRRAFRAAESRFPAEAKAWREKQATSMIALAEIVNPSHPCSTDGWEKFTDLGRPN